MAKLYVSIYVAIFTIVYPRRTARVQLTLYNLLLQRNALEKYVEKPILKCLPYWTEGPLGRR